MIDILKRIFIGVVIGMSIFFLKTHVFALTYDMEIKDEFFIYNTSIKQNNLSCTTSNHLCNLSFSFDTSFTNTNGYHFAVFSPTGTIYSNFSEYSAEDGGGDPESWETSTHDILSYIQRIVLISSNGAWSSCELQNNFVVCPIKKNLTYTSLRFTFIGSTGINYVAYITLTNTVQFYNSILVTSSTIEQQTDDILDSDSPASAEYNNDYSTTAYDSAEASMNQNLDQDVSGFNFNPLDWSRSFSFIWGTVTDLVQINSKVFLMITTFLTFSFVGLVIGRS